jgi:hypothetical protein
MVMTHSALVVVVMSPVLAIFASMLPIFFTFVHVVVHAVPMEMELEEIQFHLHFPLRATRRSHIR